jgi:hypothetical protein
LRCRQWQQSKHGFWLTNAAKIRVLVVDDSALMRGLLSQMIGLAPDIEVVGAAPDARPPGK